jgi:hypothetical protein
LTANGGWGALGSEFACPSQGAEQAIVLGADTRIEGFSQLPFNETKSGMRL